MPTSTPVPCTPVPPPADSEGGTGGITPRGDSGGMPYADYAFIKSVRIVLESGGSPTVRLVVTTPCVPPDGPPSISDYYPWIEVGMVTQIRECTVESAEGLVEVSISLEDRAHLFEDCKTYAVVINQRRTHATANDIAGFCASESDPAPEDILSLMNIDDVRLSHPPGSGLLVAADYLLTGSCVGLESHRLERDGDGLKVYITGPTETPPRRFVPLSCRGLLGEYSIPLMGFEVGQTVSVWVNGTALNLVVPEPGQVVGPKITVGQPFQVKRQLDQSEWKRARVLWATNGARSYSFEFMVLDD